MKRWIRKSYFGLNLLKNRLLIQAIKLLRVFAKDAFQSGAESLEPPRQVIKSTADWMAAQSPNAQFTGHYIQVDQPYELVRTNQPQTGDATPHPQFAADKVAHLSGSFVAVIPHGRVWGEYGAIVTEDNSLLADLSVYRLQKSIGYHRVFSDWHYCSVKKIEGTVANLATDSAFVYYHWIADLLLRYGLLIKAGYTADSFDKIIIGNHAKRFQKDTLEVLGLLGAGQDKVILTAEHPLIWAKSLVVPSYPAMGQGFHPWHMEMLRSWFLPAVKDALPTLEPNARIYVSRGQATYRRVMNEEAVMTLLTGYGFKVVQLETLSFLEQVALMASSEMVVAPHGSGLTNIIFCRPGTKIIEIFSPEMVGAYYWIISDLCQLDYYYTIGDRLRSEKYDHTWNASADVLVSLDRLQKTLDLALAASTSVAS